MPAMSTMSDSTAKDDEIDVLSTTTTMMGGDQQQEEGGVSSSSDAEEEALQEQIADVVAQGLKVGRYVCR